MNILVEKPNKGEQKVVIELTEAEMQVYYQKALQKLSQQINVKGFRPGKIPASVVEQHVNKEAILANAIDLALPVTYTEAITKEKIEAIGQPQVNLLQPMPLKYEAIVPIYPDVKVSGYEKLKLERKKIEVSDSDIKEELTRMQKSHSIYTESDRPAKLSDRVEIDFDGFDEDGNALDNTSSKNHPLILGDKSFIPGFEEQVVGMNKGDKKEIKVTFPEDYFHEPFRKKVVVFKVRLVRHEEMKVPEIDEELIEKVSGKKQSVEEFRKMLKENMQRMKEEEETSRLEGILLEKIMESTKVDLPKPLIDQEVNYMLESQKRDMKERGVAFEQYLEATQQTEEELKKSKVSEAEKRLKTRFGIQEVFKKDKIEVKPDELEKAFQDEIKLLETMNVKPNDHDQQHLKLRLENRIKLEKLLKKYTK